MDAQTEIEVLKFRYMNPHWTLPADYFKLMAKINDLSADEVDEAVEDLVDQVELTELKLKKAQTQFNVRAQDKAYYAQLIADTENQIQKSREEMLRLQSELEQEQTRKRDRADFEAICRQINQHRPAAESQAEIERCQNEIEVLEAECASEKITSKQKQLSTLVSMIQEMRTDAAIEEVSQSAQTIIKEDNQNAL